MSCQSVRSWLETAQHYISRSVHWFTRCIGHLRRQHQVHPASLRSISALTHSKIVKLGSKRRIRVIHIEPSKQRTDQDIRGHIRVKYSLENKLNIEESKHISAKNIAFSADANDSDSEGYWFTRWNRPLKFSEACRCSFRNKAQESRTASQVFGIHKLPIEETVTNENDCRKQHDFSETTLININENVDAIVSDVIEEMLDKVLLTVFQDQQKKADASSCEDYFGCRNELEEISERLQQSSSCKTKIICQKLTSGFHVKEAAFGDHQECILEVPSNIVTYSSSGCINPSFLGTNIDPDTFGYVISCENPFVKIEHSDRDANILEFEEIKCFDDSDSGFNTASLESTTNHSQKDEGVCCASKRHNMHTETDPTFDVKIGKKLEVCNAIGPETASISDSKLWSPTSLDPNGVMIDTKDNLEISNQMTITSLDVNAAPSYMAEHSSPPVSRHSTNDRVKDQEYFSKQCYHTRHFARLKPVLLFLHGVGCSADLWTTLLSHFSNAGYEVLAPDMLGHGYSSAPDSPGAYIFHRLLKDVVDIFDKFVGDNKMCVVIGHAYGSSLAAALARYRAQQVSHLVLISGGGPTPLAPRTADSRPPSMSPYLQAFLKPLIFCGFRRNIIYGPCGKHIETSSVMSKGIPNYVLHHVAQGQDWSEGDSTFHRRILVPTLLVHGMQDPYVTLVQECEMERTIPRSFLELIPDAGHFAMLETPEELTHMIHCFIEWWRR